MIYTDLAPGHTISRVIKGGWQIAGGHGRNVADYHTSLTDMAAFFSAGLTTFDCADIYTGVEEMIGAFRRKHSDTFGAESLCAMKVHTKFVPNLDVLPTMDRKAVEASIDVSLKRLGTEQLDLVQFHWWNYDIDRYIEIAGYLSDLRKAGKIANIGGTNFDTARTQALLDSNIPLVSMQIQYSLLDQRPARKMAKLDLPLLCYGTVSGGLLSDKWLGAPELKEPHENRSLTKYKLVIDDWGGWDLFQNLLMTVRKIADRHETDIATVASRWVLDQPSVAAVIVGARNQSHLQKNAAIAELVLTDEDHRDINQILRKANPMPGDVYEMERDKTGRHGSIMKYNLN